MTPLDMARENLGADFVEPPPLDEAIARAQATLSDDLVIDRASALPNPLQGLWILSYVERDNPDDELLGGGLVVTADEVREFSSVPGQFEEIGVLWPEDDDS